MHSVRRSVQIALVLLALLSTGALFAADASRRTQLSLPLKGFHVNLQSMPPDPGDWCQKVDAERLQSEMAKARAFFQEGIGENLVDWRFLRRALKQTGAQVAGPEDRYWLEMIEGLYSGCP